MAERGIDLVYGGGRLGLMGIIADTVLEQGGKVYGVIPEALVAHEVAHLGCTELFKVADMHERKAKMTELCDAFVALPGGIGTLDELFEAWTWNAPGYHSQPLCLLNVKASGTTLPISWIMSRPADSSVRRGGRNCSRPKRRARRLIYWTKRLQALHKA